MNSINFFFRQSPEFIACLKAEQDIGVMHDPENFLIKEKDCS